MWGTSGGSLSPLTSATVRRGSAPSYQVMNGQTTLLILSHIYLTANTVLVFNIHLTNITDGLEAATIDVESADKNDNHKIDAHEIPALLVNYLKQSFQNYRRGGFIQSNGERTTF